MKLPHGNNWHGERKIKYWKHWKSIYGNIRAEIHETTTNRIEIHIEQHEESQLNWQNWNSMLYTLKGRIRSHIYSSNYSVYIKYTLNIYYVLGPVWSTGDTTVKERKKGKSLSHVRLFGTPWTAWIWELDYKESWGKKKSWALKNWCFWTAVLEKTLESPLDCKENQPVHPKGDQS